MFWLSQLTERSRISEYFQTLHSMFSWDLTMWDKSVWKQAVCKNWHIQGAECVWQHSEVCWNTKTHYWQAGKRWMGRINRDSKFTVCKRHKVATKVRKNCTHANLKGHMKLPDRADELLSLALKDYMSEERTRIFKDAIWKGPEAKPLLAWACLIPYSILSVAN